MACYYCENRVAAYTCYVCKDGPTASTTGEQMTRLKDGESRRMQPKYDRKYMGEKIEVVAIRIDSDTPYVAITAKDRVGGSTTTCLEDTLVKELVDMLNRALDILPSSK